MPAPAAKKLGNSKGKLPIRRGIAVDLHAPRSLAAKGLVPQALVLVGDGPLQGHLSLGVGVGEASAAVGICVP